MSGNVVEVFTRKACPVNAATVLPVSKGVLGGFVCVTAGTITVTDEDGAIVTALPVTAGVYHPLPFGTRGTVTLTTASGASGTAAVL